MSELNEKTACPAEGIEQGSLPEVSHDGQLELYIEKTLFVIDLRATRVAALFETIDGGAQLKVEMMGEMAGERSVLSGFGENPGALFQDPSLYSSQCSGHL